MCVFCKIASGEIPSYTIYENEAVRCFLDLSQVTKGHTLVVPKKHYENIFDLETDAAFEVMKAANVVSNMLKNKLGIQDVNLINNSGARAGQTVMHFHLHVIPRTKDDGQNLVFKEGNPSKDELEATFKEIKK